MGMSDRIKERRKALGYTQEDLAIKLGLQKSAIAKYENGRVQNIKRSVILQMATILECNPSYLMGWNDSESHDIDFDPLSPDEKALLSDYHKLNDLGKEKARENVADLAEIPKYTEKGESESDSEMVG